MDVTGQPDLHPFPLPEPVSPTPVRTPRLLVVDDEESIREMLHDTLHEAGSYDVDTASDGRMALQKLRSSSFDLVITDLRMPEMDGARLLDITRHEFPDIPVVVITGYARLETAIEALRLGAANFITKPFRLVEILDVVDKSLKRKTRPGNPAKGSALPGQRKSGVPYSPFSRNQIRGHPLPHRQAGRGRHLR